MAIIVSLSIIAILVISFAIYATYKYNKDIEEEEKSNNRPDNIDFEKAVYRSLRRADYHYYCVTLSEEEIEAALDKEETDEDFKNKMTDYFDKCAEIKEQETQKSLEEKLNKIFANWID